MSTKITPAEFPKMYKNEYTIINALTKTEDNRRRAVVVTTSILNDYNLKDCNPQSILNCAISILQLGLDLDKNIGEAYVVPYKNEKSGKISAQLQIGARGYKSLAFRSGFDIRTFPVYEVDEFSADFGEWDANIIFKPDYKKRNNDKSWIYQNLTGVLVMTRNHHTEVIEKHFVPKSEIERLRLSSPNQKGNPSGVWQTWYDRMAEAKATKIVAKKLPLGSSARDLNMALAIDDKSEIGEKMPSYKVDKETGEIIEVEEDKPSTPKLEKTINVSANETNPLEELENELIARWGDKKPTKEELQYFKNFIKARGVNLENQVEMEGILADKAGLSDLIDEYKNQ